MKMEVDGWGDRQGDVSLSRLSHGPEISDTPSVPQPTMYRSVNLPLWVDSGEQAHQAKGNLDSPISLGSTEKMSLFVLG